jgi:hypothetical protein
LSYEDNVSFDGVTNASELMGCYALSNPITVNRYAQPTAGVLEGGPFEFCVGDGEADNIPEGAITLSGNMGTNSAWVVTDEAANILALPASPYDVNFDEAPAGTCLVWHLSYEDNVSFDGVTNASELMGCYALSNAVTVVRKHTEGGTMDGGPFEFIVGDGVADNIPDAAITLTGNEGTNSQWVITNDDGTVILALPTNSYTEVDFDTAPAGTSLVWHLSYEDGLEGLAVDAIVADLVGCFSFSNSVSVVKTATSAGLIWIIPNPSGNTANLDLSNFKSDDVTISIHNLLNARVFNRAYDLRSSNSRIISINVSSYNEGLYFVRVTDNTTGKNYIKRLIVN